MERRILALLLALLLVPALCACGGAGEAPAVQTEAPAAEAAPQTEAPAPTPTPAPTPDPAAMPALPDAGLHAAQAPEDPEIFARRALAESFVDRDAALLLEELGEPLERNYGPSCLGDGEDGEWSYEGFIVYTYRDGDREKVVDVK